MELSPNILHCGDPIGQATESALIGGRGRDFLDTILDGVEQSAVSVVNHEKRLGFSHKE